MKEKVLNIRLDNDTYNAIKTMAEFEGKSISSFCREWLTIATNPEKIFNDLFNLTLGIAKQDEYSFDNYEKKINRRISKLKEAVDKVEKNNELIAILEEHVQSVKNRSRSFFHKQNDDLEKDLKSVAG